jgi:hypothetical protein
MWTAFCEFVEVQVVAVQLSDSDDSLGNGTRPQHMNRKELKKKYSKVTNEKC